MKLSRLRLLIILLTVAIGLGVFAGGYIALAKGVPSVRELKQYKAIPGTKVYADDDTLIGEFKIEKGVYVPLSRMPKHLVNAVVAVEDSRFWKHKGIDYLAIVRAAVKDLLHVGLKEGGSTITQQLAKITFLTPEKTLQRKVREAALAMKIEKNLSKNEILELYLNRVYLGHGAYGMEMASRIYFGKSVRNITLPEAALLAGLAKAPSTYSPYNNVLKAKERQETVLARMEEEGYIKRSEREKAAKQPLYLSTLRRGQEANNYFLEYVRKYLEEKYGIDMVYKSGLSVYTTLDKRAQATAAWALQEGLREVDKRRGWRGRIDQKDVNAEKELRKKKEEETSGPLIGGTGDLVSGVVLKVGPREAILKARGVVGRLPLENARWAATLIDPKTGKTSHIKNFTLDKVLRVGDVVKVGFRSLKGTTAILTLEQDPEVEGALVALDPNSGFIRAMVGGYDFARSEFNRAAYAKRQPGSAFKPVIYAAAMDNGFTPASIINDERVTYKGGPKGDWTPENYDHIHYGPTRLRDALAYSRNVVTVKLVDAIGVDKVTDFARNIGIEEDFPHNLSIALGSVAVTPLELAESYSVFASGGMKMQPLAVKYVTDAHGRILESNQPEGKQVISPQTAFLITSMMEDVVNYGTGWRAKALGRPVAGKTGTTNDYRDAWFVGYLPDMISAVWVGFDDMRTLGSRETGATAASPIWVDFMRSLDLGDRGFVVPEGIASCSIDPASGLLARDPAAGIMEYFKNGTQPREYSSFPGMRESREPFKLDFD
ncbi:MAG: PBP1A family penicillin-binding protein [Nitrospirae bacterium]|nr:PBP1A family penicillin-binding protein [Nitrospirota bacterium]